MAPVAEATEPRPFAAASDAQPLSSASYTRKSSHEQPLAWRSREVQQASHTTPASSSRRAGWNTSKIDPRVRAASHSDPFTDPFGDRTHAQTGMTLALQAPGNEAPSLQPLNGGNFQPAPAGEADNFQPTPRSQFDPAPAFGQPEPPAAALPPAAADPMPQPELQPEPAAPSFQPAPSVEPMPVEPMPPRATLPYDDMMGSGGRPCDRVYNDRNCCDADLACQDFISRLKSDSIRKISLDITPRFQPDQTPEEDDATREDKLRFAEPRDWRNRSGELLATGRLANLIDGRAIIADDAGAQVAAIPLATLAEDEICFVAAWWRIPGECILGEDRLVARNWMPSTVTWHASALCHKPLYFEQVQLERYGHTAGPIRGPIVAGAHFFGSLITLPYQMAMHPPTECQYALGYYRPGSCAPWMIPPVPLSVRGAVAQAGFVVGGIYVIP